MDKQYSFVNISKSLASRLDFNIIAKRCGFVQRTPRKIIPDQLLSSFILSIIKGNFSYSVIAQSLSITKMVTVARQSIQKRTATKEWAKLVFIALERLLLKNNLCDYKLTNKLFSGFNKVLIEDSTTIPLNKKLSSVFPGSKNQTGKSMAMARIQAVINILTEEFMSFRITPYTNNDQSHSPNILKFAQKGDLVIRDLGYSVLKVFNEMIRMKISFLSRLRYNIKIFDPESGAVIDLYQRLKKNFTGY